MAAVGGDILEISYTHPTLGNGFFYPKSGEDSTINLGGFRKNDDNQGIDGSGSAIYQMNRSRWSFEVTCSNDSNTRKDFERYNALANDPQEADWTATHVNGSIYRGKGSIVGDPEANGNAATFTLKIAGGGTLTTV